MISTHTLYICFSLLQPFLFASASLVTIRLPRYACPANSVIPSSSQNAIEDTTTVLSTATVSPTPDTDYGLNNGEKFVMAITVHPSSRLQQRQQPQQSWIMENGNTTTDVTIAAQFHILDGILYGTDGTMSTDVGVKTMPFTLPSTPGTINTTFVVQDGGITWTNPEFTENIAQFYRTPVGLLKNALILAKFIGPMNPERGWTPISLVAQSVSGLGLAVGLGSSTPNAAPPSTEMSSLGVAGTSTEAMTAMASSSLPIISSNSAAISPSSAGTSSYPQSSSTTPIAVFSTSTLLATQLVSSSATFGTQSSVATPSSTPSSSAPSIMLLASSNATVTTGSSVLESSNSVSSSSSVTLASSSSTSGSSSSALAASLSSSSPSPISYSASTTYSAFQSPSPSSSNTILSILTISPSSLGPSSIFDFITTSTSNTLSTSPLAIGSSPSSIISSNSGPSSNPISPISISSLPPTVFSSNLVAVTATSTTSSSSQSASRTTTTSATATGPTTVPTAFLGNGYYSFQGCFNDIPSYRDLRNDNDIGTANITGGMTVEKCAALCGSPQSGGPYIFMGVDYGSECYCSMGLYATIDGTSGYPIGIGNCTNPVYACAGDKTEFCGGYGAQSLYKFTSGPPAVAPPASSIAISSSYSPSSSVVMTSSAHTSTPGTSTAIASTTSSPIPSFASTSSSTSTIPSIHLPSPTACLGSSANDDDDYCEIDLPFPMTLFGHSSTQTFASTNGILALDYGSAQYYQAPLPASTIPPYTACPFWDDLYLYGGGSSSTTEGIYYQIDNASSAVTYEYLLSAAGVPGDYYHFQVYYRASAPGVVAFRYWELGDLSGQAVVGVQGGSSAVQYNASAEYYGQQVTCDTTSLTCTSGNFTM